MPLSDLASEIYVVLRQRVPGSRAEITYEDLVGTLGPLPSPNQDLAPRDPRLDAALGEIVVECRRCQLPALSAIVVRKHEGTPGEGYYPVAHPDEAGDKARSMIAWGEEVQSAKQTTYPDEL